MVNFPPFFGTWAIPPLRSLGVSKVEGWGCQIWQERKKLEENHPRRLELISEIWWMFRGSGHMVVNGLWRLWPIRKLIYNLKHAWNFFQGFRGCRGSRSIFGIESQPQGFDLPLNKGNNRGIFWISSTRMVEIRFEQFPATSKPRRWPKWWFFREFIQTLLTLW